MEAGTIPDEVFLADIATAPPARVSGTAEFMSSGGDGIPNVLLHHIKHNQVLHAQNVLFPAKIEPVPWIDTEHTMEVRPLGHGMSRVIGRVGVMQQTDVPRLLQRCSDHGIKAERMTTTYYLGRQTLLTSGKSRMARWRKVLFSFLSRNARPPTAFFNLPPNRVVELGFGRRSRRARSASGRRSRRVGIATRSRFSRAYRARTTRRC